MFSWKTTFLFLSLLQAGLQTAAAQYSSTSTMNKLLFVDGGSGFGRTTLVSLDGMSENCDLAEYHPDTDNYPAAVTYSDKDGLVLACGGWEEDADRCWSFDGSTWSPIPNSLHKHCLDDAPNVLVDDGWWIFGRDNVCSSSSKTSEIYNGQEWIPGPTLPHGEINPTDSCVINLNTTHTMISGGYAGQTLSDVWLYDWSTQEWTKTGSLNQARHTHGCVSLGDQGALVVGGYDASSGSNIYSVELYNPVDGTWSNQPDLNIEPLLPIYPMLFNWNNQIIAIIYNQDGIYKRSKENGEWSVLEGVKLPGVTYGYPNDKVALVPDDFAPSCN